MSLHDDLQALARVSGVADMQLAEFVTRGLAALPDTARTVDLAKWVQAQRAEAPHLFLQPVVSDVARQEREAILAKLSASEKLTRGREGQQPVPKARPQPQADADVAAFAGMAVADFHKLHPNKRADLARALTAQQQAKG